MPDFTRVCGWSRAFGGAAGGEKFTLFQPESGLRVFPAIHMWYTTFGVGNGLVH